METDPESKEVLVQKGLNLQLYPLKIKVSQTDSLTIYFNSLNNRNVWLKTIQAVLGCKNVLETYKMGKMLGQGQFGLVYKGKNRTSGQKVAIKKIAKKALTVLEAFQQRREIEVLKMC